MRIGIVHDWLDTWGGSEAALGELLHLFPGADLFSLVDFMPPEHRQRLGNRPTRTSFLQRMPFARTAFRRYLPLFPGAMERFDVSACDLVISSSHAVAKGVRTTPAQLHICYCYTPMRYAWDLRGQYLAQTGLDRGLPGWAARRMLDRLQAWDLATSARVDHFVAISENIAERIARCYGRPATVIYPPVAFVPRSYAQPAGSGPYITVSRLVPYKRVDAIAAAFRSLPDRELLIIGEGPERARVERAAPSNVRLLGRLPDDERDRQFAGARAFLFAADEDFGIAPVEAQAHGIPVIAFRHGGALETVRGLDHAAPTGVFFDEQTPSAIANAVRRFETAGERITARACRDNAERFSVGRFRTEFAAFVDARIAEFAARRGLP